MSRATPTASGPRSGHVLRGLSPRPAGLESAHDPQLPRRAVLLLLFASRDASAPSNGSTSPDLTVERITTFLAALEAERHNSIATRNARLGAIHVFATVPRRPSPRASRHPAADHRHAVQARRARGSDRVPRS